MGGHGILILKSLFLKRCLFGNLLLITPTWWLHLLQEVPHRGLLLSYGGAEGLLVQHLQQYTDFTHQQLHCCIDIGEEGVKGQGSMGLVSAQGGKGHPHESKQALRWMSKNGFLLYSGFVILTFSVTLHHSLSVTISHLLSPPPLSVTDRLNTNKSLERQEML